MEMTFLAHVTELTANSQIRQFLKILIAFSGMFLLFFMPLVQTGVFKRRGRLALDVALIVTTLLSGFAYFEFGWKRYDRYMNPHDVYHYYIGAKYSQEHRYFNLYRCAFLADQEMNQEFKGNAIRNLETHAFESTSEVTARAEELKKPFTPERWEEFKHDIAYFQRCVRNDSGKWTQMLRDKGYNATPVWNAVARFLANHAPAPDAPWQELRDHISILRRNWTNPAFSPKGEWAGLNASINECQNSIDANADAAQERQAAFSELRAALTALESVDVAMRVRQSTAEAWASADKALAACAPDSEWPMRFLTYIDLVLLLVMSLFVWWAFGWRVMLLVLIFHDTNYMMNFVHIKGAFMRLDWITLLVIGACLLRKGWYGTAGGVMAYAGMARIFPFVFCFGIGAKLAWNILAWLWSAYRKNAEPVRLHRGYVRFFLALGIFSCVLVGGSLVADGGAHLWRSFNAKIAVHNSDISTTRVGFKYVILGIEQRSRNAATYPHWAWTRGVFENARELHAKVTAAANSETAPFWARLARPLVGGPREAGTGQTFAALTFLWYPLLLIALAIAGIAVRKLDDYETIPLSFTVAYFLTAPTFYYYVMLVVVLFLFLPRLVWPNRLTGAAILFLFSIFAYFLNFMNYEDMTGFYILSCLLFWVCVYIWYAALVVPRPLLADAAEPIAPCVLAEAAGATGGGTDKKSAAVPPAASAERGNEVRRFLFGLLAALLVGGAVFAGYRFIQHQYANPAQGAVQQPAAKDVLQTAEPPAITATAEVAESVAAPAPQEPTTQPAPAEAGGSAGAAGVQLVFAGDVMLSRNVEKNIRAHGYDFTFPFQKVAGYIRAADIAFCNLECPISGRGTAVNKKYIFNAPPESVEGLVFAGFDVVSIANNHTLDFGPDALSDTLSIVNGRGIKPIGLSLKDAPQEPAILDAQGLKVGYLAYCDPVPEYAFAKEFNAFDLRPAKATPEAVSRDIAALRPKVDVLVVSLHCGVEYKPMPTEQTIQLTRYIIDAGADIVAGHHPHVQHDAEIYKEGLIIYSLGNFVFDQYSRPLTRQSRLFRVFVDKEGFQRAEFLPLEIANNEWRPIPTSEAFIPVQEGVPYDVQQPAQGSDAESTAEQG